MKISTKSRYGARALLDLALNYNGHPIMLKDIARRQEISLPYLEHIIAPLIAAGMVRSNRGAKGGICLARAPQQIRLSDIILALEGPISLVECSGFPQACSHADTCATKGVWDDMKAAIDSVLASVTLHELAERQKGKQESASDMYSI